MMGGRHSFRGYKDTLLLYDPEKKEWHLQLYSTNDAIASVKTVEYPFGTHVSEMKIMKLN